MVGEVLFSDVGFGEKEFDEIGFGEIGGHHFGVWILILFQLFGYHLVFINVILPQCPRVLLIACCMD
jgi:hypothetical protein